MFRLLLVIVSTVLVTATVTVASAQQSLRELVRQHHGAIGLMEHAEYPIVDIDQLVAAADYVISGVVTSSVSKLTDNEESIWTATGIQVLEVWKSTSESRLNPGDSIVLRQDGGEVLIEGYNIKSSDSDFPLLQRSNEYVLFLRRDKSGMFVSAYGGQGVFRIDAGNVRQISGASTEWVRKHGATTSYGELQKSVMNAIAAKIPQ